MALQSLSFVCKLQLLVFFITDLQDKVTYDAFHDQYQSSHPLHSSTDEIITPQDAHMLEAGEVLENFQYVYNNSIID